MERHLGDDEWTDLTERQEQVLDFIESRMEQGLRPPSRDEIAKHLNVKSPNAAEDHLRALVRKGRIELIPGKRRNIKLLQL